MQKYGAEFFGTFCLVLGGCGSAVISATFPNLGIGFVAQVAGAITAGGVLYVIASGQAGFDVAAGFASNGYGAHSPGGYSLLACLVTEIVMTMMFLLVILGSTDERAPRVLLQSQLDFVSP